VTGWFPLVLSLEPPLGVHGSFAAHAGGGDGLAVAVVDDIARREDTGNRRFRSLARGLDVSTIELEVVLEE